MKIKMGVAEGAHLSIDLDSLVESRMLVTASSGAGKSWLLRRLLEKSHGHIQQIVLDRDDEFFTLREKFDYVLARKNGDCPAEVASAGLLARRLMELGVSAIVNLYDLGIADRQQFVKAFCESLLDMPKNLYRPMLLVIDEAHVFAAEDGSASRAAVDNLCAQGRKRGIVPICATQRLSKFSKDAAAELKNRMVGNTGLDIDVKRSADELGFSSKADRQLLRELPTGEWFTYGPAIRLGDESVRGIARCVIGPVFSPHPKVGQRTAPPRPPSESVRAVLGKLAEIPAEVKREKETADSLRARIRELEIAAARGAEAQGEPDVHAVADAVARAVDSVSADFRAAMQLKTKELGTALELLRGGESTLAHAIGLISGLAESPEIHAMPVPAALTQSPKPTRHTDTPELRHGAVMHGNGYFGKMERALLTVLAQERGNMLDKGRVLARAGYRASGDVSTAWTRFGREGLVQIGRGGVTITALGLKQLGEFTPLPTRSRLREALLSGSFGNLGTVDKKLLRALCDQYPNAAAKGKLCEAAGYRPSGDTSTSFTRLVRLGYAQKSGSGALVADGMLF